MSSRCLPRLLLPPRQASSLSAGPGPARGGGGSLSTIVSAISVSSILVLKGARSKIRPLLYKRFFVSEEMRKTSLPSRNLCISTLVSWLSTLPRHTGKCVTWILLLPRHPTWILHLLRWRRGSFIFLVTQEVHNVDNTYILVANVDSIVSSSHRNCTTWIFKHPRCRRGYSKFLVIQKYRV